MRSCVLRNMTMRIIGGFVILDGSTFESIAVDSVKMENCQELTTFEKCIDNPVGRLEDIVNATLENRDENLIPKLDIPPENSLETQNPSPVDEESSSTEAGSVQENSSEDASGENVDLKIMPAFDVNEVIEDFTFEELRKNYEVAQNRIEELETKNENQVRKILELEMNLRYRTNDLIIQECAVDQMKKEMQNQKYGLVVLFIAHILRFFW